MSLYTCDIHGGSHHICGECAANDLSRAEEAEGRLEDEVRALERKLDDARAAWTEYKRKQAVWQSWDGVEQLDRALAEVGR